ncbi:MAG: pantoate kinase [Promethearchaeota archaeon]|jgi:pantoate kinase
MAPYKTEVVVEVPHRISGFFEIVDEINGVPINNPEKIGSRGAGFNLSAVGTTKIQVENSDKPDNQELSIFINHKKVDEKAETTCYIYNHIRKYLKKSVKINIFHNFDLPVGCGYGASGSGALGTIHGLSHALNLNLSDLELGRIAHIAEVVNRTGLGTVCGQLRGGLCILKEPGYPCISESIKIPKNLKILCGSFGMIHTKSILTDPILNSNIKKAGRKAQEALLEKPDIKTFINASKEFVRETKMLQILNLHEIKELVQELNNLKILGASMNQLGRSVYAICTAEEEGKVLEIYDSYKPEITTFNLSISLKGPKIIINNKN